MRSPSPSEPSRFTLGDISRSFLKKMIGYYAIYMLIRIPEQALKGSGFENDLTLIQAW